ncbi:hypothetical protein BDY21DRAFT_348211 [Lineolata rhizophorae]|uniref:Maintenance of telomere capping protein 6 n=1 Tax=Lineolata rhizophorae TaxID=578093 RepID=A0A6A6NWX2_9PEZI|nr:hypothetical protein BDY21DRAFT_348211 [Lineolata rhizophorae]
MTSTLYEPADAAKTTSPWDTAFLSQRDVGLQIPINFVSRPGAWLARACFAHGRYLRSSGAKCISNLLAAGFRRFILDIYWDPNRRVWSLCPLGIPVRSDDSESSPSSVSAGSSTSATSTRLPSSGSSSGLVSVNLSSDGEVTRRQNDDESTIEETFTSGLSAPSTVQLTSSPLSSSNEPSRTASYNVSTTNSTAASSSTSGSPSSNGASLVHQVGPYQCSEDLNIALVIALFSDFLDSTGNTLEANVAQLTLNLHTAGIESDSNQTPPTLVGPSLPAGDELLGNILNANISNYLFSPSRLYDDRADLNTSWYNVDELRRPDPAYYTTNVTRRDVHSTPDGWPSESYLVFERNIRFLVEFGTVEPQIRGYGFESDADEIFPADTFRVSRHVSFATGGDITEGCFFDAGVFDLETVNSSWATANPLVLSSSSSQGSINATFNSTSELVSCGISPIVSATLENITADVNISAYQPVAYASIWSWAPGEPVNTSDSSNSSTGSSSDDDEDNDLFRCAMLDIRRGGRWFVAECTDHRRAACRVNDEPYRWRISEESAVYSSSLEACDDGSSFAAPRTGLENSYLAEAVRSRAFRDSEDGNDNDETALADLSDDDAIVWVNFNSLDLPNCWVVGVNESCPYTEQKGDESRTVVVPTVAAVIVFVLFMLTLFIKCAANRQSVRRRRRRKGEGGWDYEGVPS